MNTVFLRALEADDKAAALLAAIHAPEAARGRTRFEVDPASFASVPRSPFAYWVSDRVRGLFAELPAFEEAGRTAKVGLQTSDDFRFVRAWWEVPPAEVRERWFPFTKGGAFSPYYADISLCVDWFHNGAQSWAIYEARRDVVGGIIKNHDFYFRPGLTWPLRGVRFSSQAVPVGCVFSIAGKMSFVADNRPAPWLGLFNSKPFDQFVAFFAGKIGGVQYEVGLIQSVPIPPLTATDQSTLATLAHRAWSLKRTLDTRTETSHAFTLPALLQVPGATLADRAAAWSERVRAVEAELAAIQAEIDERCFDLYSIDEANRRAITEGFGGAGDSGGGDAGTDGDADADRDTEGESNAAEDMAADSAGLAGELIAWAVGAAFGRFDVRLAIGERQPPPEPDPFDPLPVCSPGMLTGGDGLPLAAPPPGYPLAFPAGGVLADDPGDVDDLTARVRDVFGTTFGADADARWQEAAALVDPRGRDLRRWLARDYFNAHLRAHSKSRRRAPIYWPLGTPSASYAVWLYCHRFTRDTLFKVLNDCVTPKLRHEERRHSGLIQEGGQHPTPSQRRDIGAQELLVEELRALREELARVAPLWHPDLNDGVIINLAPLWRLIPQNKAWQREVKACWDQLVAGAYDWAHLAMHLWPERVVPKCATDRSLAIAHGLEDALWSEGADGKWRAREVDAAILDCLVIERTLPAVKAALQDLLSAPTATTARTRRGHAGNGGGT